MPKPAKSPRLRASGRHDSVSKPANATGAKHIHTDVLGAPYRIGTPVRVVQLVDETGNRRWLRRIGVVKYFDYYCGCGQTYPDDPMIGVESRRGNVEQFWKEELRLIPTRTARQRRFSKRRSPPGEP
jgi:hypothetical protein